jgi:hypothetical protein
MQTEEVPQDFNMLQTCASPHSPDVTSPKEKLSPLMAEKEDSSQEVKERKKKAKELIFKPIEPLSHFSEMTEDAKNIATGMIAKYKNLKVLAKSDPSDSEFWTRTASYNKVAPKNLKALKKKKEGKCEKACKERCKRLDPRYTKCPCCGLSTGFANVLFYDADKECLSCHTSVTNEVKICAKTDHKYKEYAHDLKNPETKKNFQTPIEYCINCEVIRFGKIENGKTDNKYRRSSFVEFDKNYLSKDKKYKKKKESHKRSSSSSEGDEEDADSIELCELHQVKLVRVENGFRECPVCDASENSMSSEEDEEEESESSSSSVGTTRRNNPSRKAKSRYLAKLNYSAGRKSDSFDESGSEEKKSKSRSSHSSEKSKKRSKSSSKRSSGSSKEEEKRRKKQKLKSKSKSGESSKSLEEAMALEE